jgi:hypothetical protein
MYVEENKNKNIALEGQFLIIHFCWIPMQLCYNFFIFKHSLMIMAVFGLRVGLMLVLVFMSGAATCERKKIRKEVSKKDG